MARLVFPSPSWRRWCLLAPLVTGIVLALSVVIGPAAAATPIDEPAQPAQPGPAKLPAIEIVVLVDESGSLSEEDVVREKEAARSIASSALSPESTITVVGFGSSDADGQSAVDVVCRPTVLDTAKNRDAVAVCIGQLDRRTPEEGFNTDHVAALRQALGYVDNGSTNPKVVFLLTDGKLSVPKTEAYGRDLGDEQRTTESRNAAALDQVPGVLDDLQAAGAQVWPLGFGEADQGELARFPAGRSCDPKVPAPAVQVIGSSAELSAAVLAAFSSAGCLIVDPSDPMPLPPEGAVDLTVEIPPIASDSAILVYKRDARIVVSYRDPQGRDPAKDSAGESAFQFSGQGTETESLRIVDPVPGTWTVRLNSAGGVGPQEVAATVVYQGAVSAALAVTPPQPAAGEEVDVEMQVRARRAGITDPAVLAGLTFTADLTTGGSTSAPVPLTDPEGDGTFSGRLTVPEGATGDLRFTGRVSGLGIGGDERTYVTRVSPTAATLQAQIVLDTGDGSVTPGGSINGQVKPTNTSGEARRLRLVVDRPSPGAAITVEPAVLDVPASGSAPLPFALRFDAGTALGANQVALQVVDNSDPSLLVAERLLAIDVEPPPGVIESFWWVLVVIAVVLAAGGVALLVVQRRRRKRRAVQGLRVELHRNSYKIFDLEPDDPDADVFRFAVYDDRFTEPKLTPAGAGDTTAYELRRNGDGLTLESASVSRRTVQRDEPIPDVSSDMTFVIRDERSGATPPLITSPAGPGAYDPSGATAFHPIPPPGPPGPFGGGGPPGPYGGTSAGPPPPGYGPSQY